MKNRGGFPAPPLLVAAGNPAPGKRGDAANAKRRFRPGRPLPAYAAGIIAGD
jgi:hypothetical protein